MSQFFGDSIFWIEIEKVKPNPYQPRHEFDDSKLRDLADSIRMYGVLQPLVVTRHEKMKDDGGLAVEYELISGERRLRASRLAGLAGSFTVADTRGFLNILVSTHIALEGYKAVVKHWEV